MAVKPETEAPRLFPTMRCRDADRMMRWLVEVLGFSEHFAHRDKGIVEHAQMARGSSILMLGQSRDDDYGKQVGDLDGRRTDALYLAVDDVDAVFAKVKASGAAIEAALRDTDYGSREFACRDPEGNLWSIGTYWPKADEKPDGA
ncbi:VOC family protein [Pseudorhodobacter sp.]|uniref:VOC family protein n=1 Tax=Pseudorhodobacter sp. TaxID=1934400 RepID=UPI0026496CF8|nr:VOC family protein [Pseudorhodobacter sp.]MDN5787826.1 VOC family protein [Pseudorhodobacter sp.]